MNDKIIQYLMSVWHSRFRVECNQQQWLVLHIVGVPRRPVQNISADSLCIEMDLSPDVVLAVFEAYWQAVAELWSRREGVVLPP